MPYCCHCGHSVGARDVYCASCGARQPSTPGPNADYLHGVSPRTALLLCYVPYLGWIVAIAVLASARFRNDSRVRFQAFQALYLFVVWLIVDSVFGGPMFGAPFWGPPFHFVSSLLQALLLGTSIFMMIKTSHDETYKLPILGELAEKSVSEQR